VVGLHQLELLVWSWLSSPARLAWDMAIWTSSPFSCASA
jgi:hypothetical protein